MILQIVRRNYCTKLCKPDVSIMYCTECGRSLEQVLNNPIMSTTNQILKIIRNTIKNERVSDGNSGECV